MLGDDDLIEMNNMQVDALKEIVNIASGNAATALSQLLQKKIDMGVPVVEIKPFEEVAKRIGDEEELVIGTLLKVLGDVPGNVLLIVKEKNAKEISDTLLNGLTVEYNDEMFLSVFQEIGNIIGNAYLTAMSSFLDVNLLSSIPYISVDMLFSVMSTAYIDANETDDYVIDMCCSLFEDDVEVGLNLFFIVPGKSLKLLIKKIDKILGM